MGANTHVKHFLGIVRFRPWHDRHMNDLIHVHAAALARQHCDQPRLLTAAEMPDPDRWRKALRQAGVPVLELDGAAPAQAKTWLDAGRAFSAEYLIPVVCFGGDNKTVNHEAPLQAFCADPKPMSGCNEVVDADWLRTRQVAITRGVETSDLNGEFRRSRERAGWIRIGWCPEALLVEGNGLLLAWSSPLPLRRIRDFSARCPEITLIAPDAEAIAREVAAQGISVKGWRFAVK